jgi:hypothetical protein
MNWALIMQLVQALLPVALQAVQAVEKATGKPTTQAIEEVVQHLTPGEPNSPSLTKDADKP